ncbi:hypothetical protein EB796_011474 [Bugula neritina]|uniref:Uncharacterized protein n=1 Tax=Bugula neritina TaxID=10212 RepID=A0A7J7JWC7_BUGNE|nr:hypothetical protein EB796_011474 [Bugula neritina]
MNCMIHAYNIYLVVSCDLFVIEGTPKRCNSVMSSDTYPGLHQSTSTMPASSTRLSRDGVDRNYNTVSVSHLLDNTASVYLSEISFTTLETDIKNHS